MKKTYLVIIINILCVLLSTLAFVFVGSKGFLFRVLSLFTVCIFLVTGIFFKRNYPIEMRKTRAAKLKVIEAMSMLFFGISLIVCIQSFDVNFDWTQKKLYHLSRETKEILHNLPIDVKIIIFLNNDGKGNKGIQYAKKMAETYRSSNPKKIKIQYIDPIRNKILADEYGFKQDGTIVFETESNREYLLTDLLYDLLRDQETLVFKGETLFSATINKLIQKKETVIYYLVGHGETDFAAPGIGGFDYVKQLFADRRYVFRPLNLENHQGMPEDANLLIISDPKIGFSSQTTEYISQYIENTGNILYLLGSKTTEDINFFLLKSGFAFIQNIVTDPSRTSSGQGEFSVIPLLSPKSDITKSLRRTTSVLFPTASLIEIVPKEFAEKEDFYDVQILAKTSKNAIAQRVKDNKIMDLLYRGTSNLALSAIVAPKSDPKKQRRAVAIGSTSFIDNTRVLMGGNSQFFLRAVDFLLDKDLVYTISPKEENLTNTVPSPEKGRLMLVFVLIWNLVFFSFCLYKLIRRMRQVKIS